ncbi:MAG TPA: hypothetical protein QGH10_26000 [Armatimonadota bacterium]|nr:hypothetical protein [Armatimonadota bacterium]
MAEVEIEGIGMLTTDHPASSDGIPVLLVGDASPVLAKGGGGEPFGPDDILAVADGMPAWLVASRYAMAVELEGGGVGACGGVRWGGRESA